jgi:hypothetical protein
MTILPLRLAVLRALAKVIETPTTGEPFAQDLTGKVLIGRNLLGEDVQETFPVISILEAPRPDIAVYAGEGDSARHDQWTLLIQGFVDNDIENDINAVTEPAYLLCALVENRLLRISESLPGRGTPAYPSEYDLGGLITGIEISPPVVRPPEKGVSNTAFFFLPVRVGIAGAPGKTVSVAP